ncbi:MAG: hypothetical protein WBX25_14000 [Rhodomicrobium sp.]
MVDDAELEDVDAMAKARERLLAKGFGSPKKERKKREKQVRSTVDGRTLKVTGRTEQFNFKAREDVKRRVVEAAKEDGLAIAQWMEQIIEAALLARKS